MEIYWVKIVDIIDESPEIKTFLLERPEGFTWDEGSHIHLALRGFDAGPKPNRSLIRHMSISTSPFEDAIGITTRIKEQCSEFKSILRDMTIGDEVAIFKTRSNIPLRRDSKNIYLLSSGVGIATFRPLVLNYFENNDQINYIHSLNIETSKNYIFSDIFQSSPAKNFTSTFVDNRIDYYNEVKSLSTDKDGLFYLVGSDEFLIENIKLLKEMGVPSKHIVVDKYEEETVTFIGV